MTEFYIDTEYIEDTLQDLTKLVNDEVWDVLDMMFAYLQDQLVLITKRLNENPHNEELYRREMDHYIKVFIDNIYTLDRLYGVEQFENSLEIIEDSIDTESVLMTRPIA